MPGAASHTSSIVLSGSAVPVGLFGEARNTRSGWNSRTAATARPGSSPNPSSPASRAPGTQRVAVICVMTGCIEYDGSKPSAVRPGPPKASSSCCMTSLEPLAAQTCSLRQPVPEIAGQVVAQAGGVTVRVPVERARHGGHGIGYRARQRGRRRVGVLVDVEPDRDVGHGCPVRLPGRRGRHAAAGPGRFSPAKPNGPWPGRGPPTSSAAGLSIRCDNARFRRRGPVGPGDRASGCPGPRPASPPRRSGG